MKESTLYWLVFFYFVVVSITTGLMEASNMDSIAALFWPLTVPAYASYKFFIYMGISL